jgi:2-polyprenyl-3-methyl-5-hydroxy-6-metoxy-1,4-benzoquinol methylase
MDAGVADRTSFEVSDISDAGEPGVYDVGFLFECLHDMSHPEVVLANARRALKPDGEIIVMDERTADVPETPSEDPVQQFFAMVSAVWCLPQGRTSPDAHPIGTVMREPDLRAVATEAGFGTVEVLDLDHPMFRFYRLAG